MIRIGKIFTAASLFLTAVLPSYTIAAETGSEPPALTWQAPPMVAPRFDPTYSERIDGQTPFYLSDEGKVCWNPSLVHTAAQKIYQDSTLIGIGQLETKDLSARQLSEVLTKSPGDTVLRLQTADPKTPAQMTLGQLREMIKPNCPVYHPYYPSIFNMEGSTHCFP